MSEAERDYPELDPDESPFEAPPIEGMPYAPGSLEDEAIKRVLRERDERLARERSAS